MTLKSKSAAGLLGVMLLATSMSPLWAQDSMGQSAPDNTKTNERDRDKGSVTADQQKENSSDRMITQQVRKAITKDKSLSTYAHNVKVVTQNGQVTLKGPVRSEEEKKSVEAAAAAVAGSDKVVNELEVAPKK